MPNSTPISFEYFPPKTPKALNALIIEAQELAALQPAFMTVTYGAGGSTKEGTLDTVKAVRTATGCETAMHLTFINTPIEELNSFTDELWEMGMRHIVALRGDMPDDLSWPLDVDTNYYQYSSDFVEGLKKRHDFEISVGAYPESHPDSPNMEADVIALKKKADAGADRAITQFFFDNDVYYRFMERCFKAGINIPIVPGMLPIANFEKMLSFAARCHANVPPWIHAKFEKVRDEAGRAELARDILAEQIEDLTAHGAPHLHFYTLNKANLSRDALLQARANAPREKAPLRA